MENFSFNLNDLKALVIGIIGYFLGQAIDRYWSHRTIKGIKRRISNAEEYKLRLDSVAESERSILLFSFRRLFAYLIFIPILLLMKTYLTYMETAFSIKLDFKLIFLADTLFWSIFLFISLLTYITLRKLTKYPESIESINQKISELNARLSSLGSSKDSNR